MWGQHKAFYHCAMHLEVILFACQCRSPLRFARLAMVQDAARKALQDAFKGKKDPFAAAEERARKQSGGGSGSGSSGEFP